MPSLTSVQGAEEVVSAAESWSYVAVRFTTFTSIVVLVGCVVFSAWMLPRIGGAHADDTERGGIAPRLRMLGLGAAIALVALVAARVALQQALLTQELGGTPVPLRDLMNGAWGIGVWLQLAGGVAGAVAFGGSGRGRLAAIARGVALSVVVSPALSGHAAGEEGWLLPVVADTVHVFAAGAWVGMLAVLVVIVLPAAGGTERRRRGAFLREVLTAFSPVALVSAALLLLTGAYASWLHVGSFSALLTTRYGVALVWKLVLVAAMLIFGAVNWRRLGPAAATSEGATRLATSSRLELVVALAILLVTAVLVARGTPSDMLG